MHGNDPSQGQGRRPRRWLAIELWVILLVVAAAHAALDLLLLIDKNDTENLETTLAAVVAGQIVDGPSTIYGPYSRSNMRVLIQAPLYYRLTGLLAWLLVAGPGVTPINAAFIAGRSVSLVSSTVLLWVIARLARLDGADRRAGVWAAALPITSMVVGTYPVTVRPDILGVLLQTIGVLLALRVILGRTPPGRSLVGAYVAFALAVCVKQHHVAAPLVSTALLAGSWLRRKELRRAIERAWLIGLAILVGYYVAEEVFTVGGISFALFKMPAALRSMSGNGLWTWFGMLYQLIRRSMVPVGLALGCLVTVPGVSRRERLDRILWIYLLAELLLLVPLCYRNEGAWVNYGIQAVVFGCTLLGRALARIVGLPLPARGVIALSLIAALVASDDARRTYAFAKTRALEEQALHALIASPQLRGWRREHVYFLGLPHYNRLYGRAQWTHDEWLYGQFERAKAAPPRSSWLRRALAGGLIRLVVVPNDPPFVMAVDPPVPPGLTETLPQLGFRFVVGLNRFGVWERVRSAP